MNELVELTRKAREEYRSLLLAVEEWVCDCGQTFARLSEKQVERGVIYGYCRFCQGNFTIKPADPALAMALEALQAQWCKDAKLLREILVASIERTKAGRLCL